MSKPRPGVEWAKNLSKSEDEKVWKKAEAHYPKVASHLKGFDGIEKEYSRLGRSLSMDGIWAESISKDDLLAIVKWKFAVGKPRHALMKHLTSNTEALVEKHSSLAIAEARHTKAGNKVLIKEATKELINLKGVGPATASAVLSLVQPKAFAYMYDEVIDCFLPKRTYTLATYERINDECTRIARNLGKEWTAARVATALWTIARVKAYGLSDPRKDPLVDKNANVDSKDQLKRPLAEKDSNGDSKDRRVTKRRKS